jgi:hypothetical protein
MRKETDEVEVEVTVEKKAKPASKKKGKIGRPKSEVAKDKKVMLSFTEDEHNQLLALAKQDGRTLTNLLTLNALSLLNN